MPLTPTDLLAALDWRYATKRFDPARPIDPATWQALERALVLTPSSFGLQPWRFIVVEDAPLRERLRAVSWNQSQVTDAARLLVFTVRTSLTEGDVDEWLVCLAESHGRAPADLDPLKKAILGFIRPMSAEAIFAWNARQAYIALGQFMAAAATLGVDTCPLEGISVADYDRLLDLDGEGYATVVACAAGHRSEDDLYAALPKARFPQQQVIVRK